MTLRVAMLDPSAFTIPYDDHLCRSLGAAGSRVTLFTRPARRWDDGSRRPSATNDARPLFDIVEHFYRLTERLPVASSLSLLRNGLKAAEHAWNMAALDRVLRRIKPDIVHFQWTVVPAIDIHCLRRMRTTAPCILTVHDTSAVLAPTSRLQKAGWRAILRTFDRLIVHTRAGEQALMAKGIRQSKISVIPHGVFGAGVTPVQDDAKEAGAGACVVLAFGSIKPYKGIDVLIRALAELPSTVRGNLRLIIAGAPGGQENELRSLAARCGVEKSIEWQLRFIPDKEVPGLLARSRVVVFPYREIDASGALMSVLPYGKAIVASRLGLFAELLRHGETALLVEPNSPAALASALAAVVENRTMAVEMGRRARTLAAEVCSWDRIAGLTLQAYRETISSRAGRSEWAK